MYAVQRRLYRAGVAGLLKRVEGVLQRVERTEEYAGPTSRREVVCFA